MVIKKCLVCNKEFTTYLSKTKTGGGKYCSQRCSSKSQITHIKKKCLTCGKEYFIFKGQAKRGIRNFCSLKCYYPTIAGKIKVCPVCKKEFHVFRSKLETHRCCSWKCHVKNFGGKNHWNWQGGLSLESYTVSWTNTLRKSIRERDNYTCGVCDKTEVKMDVHHIDYDKKNCNPLNLVTLCHSCHTKTGRNRDYWTNYFTSL